LDSKSSQAHKSNKGLTPMLDATFHCAPHERTFDPNLMMPLVTREARAAGLRLLACFSPDSRPASRREMLEALQRNEACSEAQLRAGLLKLCPQAQWYDADSPRSQVCVGEWWCVDAVEGNVNHVHGMPDWGVAIAFIRDGALELAVFYQPIGDLIYTATAGGGAYLNDASLAVSTKSALEMAIVATGQAEAGQHGTYPSIARSVQAMLELALLVRMAVPSTFPLLLMARGQNDAFWQYETALSGIAAGVLLAREAGATVSEIDGSSWTVESTTVLVAAPAVHDAAVAALNAFQGK
jgi:myo-inositol-1(or 4)-monophosphatase